MNKLLHRVLLACTLSLGLGPAVSQTQAARPIMPVAAQRAPQAGSAMLLAATWAGKRIVAVGEHGIVIISDDAGKTFRQAASVPADFTLTAVSFADAQLGWAVGHAGLVLHTTDGGEHWTTQRIDLQHDRPLFGVHFFDPQHGVAVGLWSLVLRTEDAGKSWQTVDMPVPGGAKKADLNLLGLFCDPKGRLIAPAERGMLARSDDQGRTWNYLSTGYKGSFWTGLATGDGTLLAAGLRGSLYRSADDGHTWVRLETRSTSSITALAQAGSEVVAVGLDGLVLRIADGGASVTPEVRSDRAALTAVLMAPGRGAPLLFSRQGVLAPASRGGEAPSPTSSPAAKP